MQGRVIISDAANGMLSSHAVVDLTEIFHVPMEGRPGCLCAHSGFVYCASMSDACIWRLRREDLQPVQCFAAGQDIECMCVSRDGNRLYALVGGADSLLMLDVQAGELMMSAPVGMQPRDMRMDRSGRFLAVAGGATGTVLLLEADTLRQCAEFPVTGAACGVLFAADGLIVLSAVGEYEPCTQVGLVLPHAGGFEKLCGLPGVPGGFALAMNGLLVGHLGKITMLSLQHREMRWQMSVQGLQDSFAPVGRLACYTDRWAGRVGLIDCFRPSLMTILRKPEPAGIVYVP